MVCLCACVRTHVCVCMHACVCMCVRRGTGSVTKAEEFHLFASRRPRRVTSVIQTKSEGLRTRRGYGLVPGQGVKGADSSFCLLLCSSPQWVGWSPPPWGVQSTLLSPDSSAHLSGITLTEHPETVFNLGTPRPGDL